MTDLVLSFDVALYAATGEIQMLTTVPDEDTAARLAAELGMAGWLPNPPSLQHFVSGGEFVQRAEQPSPLHIFDWDAKAWVDPRTLDDLRVVAWERIKAARADAMASGVDVPGLGRFDADADSVLKMTAVLASLAYQPDGWAVTWTRFDNTAIELGKAEFPLVAGAVMAHGDAAHQVGRALRAEIEAAASAEAIAAVQWPS